MCAFMCDKAFFLYGFDRFYFLLFGCLVWSNSDDNHEMCAYLKFARNLTNPLQYLCYGWTFVFKVTTTTYDTKNMHTQETLKSIQLISRTADCEGTTPLKNHEVTLSVVSDKFLGLYQL
jgi:hypothetical protein